MMRNIENMMDKNLNKTLIRVMMTIMMKIMSIMERGIEICFQMMEKMICRIDQF